jgi:hypothetical protein
MNNEKITTSNQRGSSCLRPAGVTNANSPNREAFRSHFSNAESASSDMPRQTGCEMLALLGVAAMALVPLVWSMPIDLGGLDLSPDASIGM